MTITLMVAAFATLFVLIAVEVISGGRRFSLGRPDPVPRGLPSAAPAPVGVDHVAPLKLE